MIHSIYILRFCWFHPNFLCAFWHFGWWISYLLSVNSAFLLWSNCLNPPFLFFIKSTFPIVTIHQRFVINFPNLLSTFLLFFKELTFPIVSIQTNPPFLLVNSSIGHVVVSRHQRRDHQCSVEPGHHAEQRGGGFQQRGVMKKQPFGSMKVF